MLAFSSLPALAAAALAVAAPEWVAAVFTHDQAVIAETARYLRIAALAQLVVSAEVVLEGALGGAGDTVPPMIASVSLTAARIPLAEWAGTRYGTTGAVVGHHGHRRRQGAGDGGALAARALEGEITVAARTAARGRRGGARPSTLDPRAHVMRAIVTLLTDFGTADGYVGEMKGVLLSAVPTSP
jgi:hypothetical protein